MRFTIATLASLAILLMAGTLPASAASDLSKAELTSADAPAGYSGPHTKLFAHYAPKLKMKEGKNGTATCDAAHVLKPGWKQGLLQDFNGPSVLTVFELCGFLQQTSAQAHTAFLGEAKYAKAQSAKSKGLKTTAPAVGNEAVQIAGAESGFATYELIFRRDNALIIMIYLGGSNYLQSSFTSLAKKEDTRLKKA